MGHNAKIKSIGLALLTSSFFSTSAMAGGFDRGAVNIDQLFETRHGIKTAVTVVSPQRDIDNLARPGLPAGIAPDSAKVGGTYVTPRLGYKFSVADGMDCLASYSEPFGGEARYGTGNVFSPSAVEFVVETEDYGLTCSYQFAAGSTSVGESFIRIIGGGSYQELDGFQSRQSLLFGSATLAAAGVMAGVGPGVGAPQTGIGTFDVSGDATGWRVGGAFEIPDIALRASVVYNSKYDYDLSGFQNNSGFGAATAAVLGAGIFGALIPITIETEIPQSLDVKFQTGIREGTLAFANFRWQDWSKLDVIPILGSTSTLAFEPGYQDGYTITVGIGQKLSENVSGLVAFTWDQGTSTTSGTQTDSWTLSGGWNYEANDQVEFTLGGAIGALEGGSSSPLPNSVDASNAVTFDFNTDYVIAGNAAFKYKF